MRRTVLTLTIALTLIGVGLGLSVGVSVVDARGGETESPRHQVANAREAYQELFDISVKSGNSLAFHVGGQTIGGVVTRVIGDDAVEVRNREFARIVLRLDSIDAVAAY